MGVLDANPPLPEFRTDYVLQEVDAAWLSQAVKPKQFIHIDQSECITCEGCVDICPWKCIHMVTPDAIEDAIGTEQPGEMECAWLNRQTPTEPRTTSTRRPSEWHLNRHQQIRSKQP